MKVATGPRGEGKVSPSAPLLKKPGGGLKRGKETTIALATAKKYTQN